MYDCMNGVGSHEIIVESPLHNQSFSELPAEHFTDVLWACRERFVELSRDRRIKYIVYFRNEGQEAGATMEHPHSQIIALPLVPSSVLTQIEGMNLYAGFRDRCAYCDIAAQEKESGERIVSRTDTHLTFVPFAAKSAFETWIMPLEHQPSYAELSYADIEATAAAVQEAIQRLDRRLKRPAYNMALRTAPVNTTRPDDFHWHIQVSPRFEVTAGFEMGTGVYINTVPPEEAAKLLREVVL
jgi:UDPglucose--hexose-1-phosphate uridylyltransferase